MKYLKRNIIMLLFFCILLGGCKQTKPLSNSVKMSFLACGDADITVIQHGVYTILIDTGEATCSDTVLSYLEEHVNSIDLMILTHPDKDHIGNALNIMKKWNVKQVYASEYQKKSSLEEELLSYVENAHINYDIVQEKKSIIVGELEIEIVPPLLKYDSSNNSSLITYVTAGNIRTFFGADIKKKRIQEVLNHTVLEADIVKLPYHGRYISNMEELLKKLNPAFVVITADKIETETEKLLKKLNIYYQNTSDTIVIEIDGLSMKRGV